MLILFFLFLQIAESSPQPSRLEGQKKFTYHSNSRYVHLFSIYWISLMYSKFDPFLLYLKRQKKNVKSKLIKCIFSFSQQRKISEQNNIQLLSIFYRSDASPRQINPRGPFGTRPPCTGLTCEADYIKDWHSYLYWFSDKVESGTLLYL